MAKALKKVALVVGAVALIATGVGAVVGGAAFVAATGVTLATVSAIGTFAAIASTALNMLAPAKPKSFMSGQQTSFKLDPQSGIPYPVGRTFLGGNAVHRDTWGTDNEYEGFAIAWAGGGPIEAIEEFKYDQATITFDGAGNAVGGFKDFMWLKSQLGACPSPALASPVAGFPGWGANSKLSGYAASVWVTRFDKKGNKFAAGKGKPGIVGRMVKVYDPRLDSTYPGGSGTCRPLQENTYVWSENPWLHALTWALGRWQNGKKVLGVGMAVFQIAIPSFVDAANIADLNNWKCGGLISSVDDKNEVLQLFAQAGGGQCIKMGAKLTAFVDAPRVSIATIRAEDLTGEISIAGTQFERTRINAVVPIYRSEAHGWEQVPAAPVRFDAYVAEDGERRTAETEFVLVQQLKQAAELAAYEVLNAREFGPIDTQLKLQWLGIEPGDLVTLDIPEDGLNMQPALALVRGLDWSTGNVAISFRSETAAKHALALGKTTTVPPSPSLTVPDLSIVAAPGVGAWVLTTEPISAPDGTKLPILVVRGATGNPNASNTVFEYRPVVAPVGSMPGSPTIGQIATDATGAEFVYEATGWARRWIMQATQDAGVTVQEFAAITPLTSYQVAVSYVSRGVLGERRVLGPVISGPLLGRGRYYVQSTAPAAEISNAGDTWMDDAGRYWSRREDNNLAIGGNRLMIGGNLLTITWTPNGTQPVREGLDSALKTALSASAAAAQLAQDAQVSADGKVQSFYQYTPPTGQGESEGDIWFDTDDGKKQYRYTAGAWIVAQDEAIGDALDAAAAADAKADGKVATFISETAPTAEGNGDLWFKASTGELRRWSGSTWGDPLVDLTASAQIVVVPAPTFKLYRTSTGSVKPDQLPAALRPLVTKGGTDARISNDFSYSVTGYGGLAGKVTVDNTNGSGSKGDVTVANTATGEGYFELAVSYKGTASGVYTTAVETVDDLPPINNSGAGGTDTTLATITSTGYAVMTSLDSGDPVLDVVIAGTGDTLRLVANFKYQHTPAAATGSPVAMTCKAECSSNNWATVIAMDGAGADATGSASQAGAPEDRIKGELVFSFTKTGLAAGTYKVRLQGKKAAAASGSLQVQTGSATSSKS